MTTDYFDVVWDQGEQLGLAGLDLKEYVQEEMAAERERILEPLRLSRAELSLRNAERRGPDELERVREELAAEALSRQEEIRMDKLRRQEEMKIARAKLEEELKLAREKQEADELRRQEEMKIARQKQAEDELRRQEEMKIARQKQAEDELRRQEERRIRDLEIQEFWRIFDLELEEELKAAELKNQGELIMSDKDVLEPCQERSVQLLRTAQISRPILRLTDLEGSCVLCTEASADAVEGVVLQEHDGILFSVYFGSKEFCEREMRWSISVILYLVVWSRLRFKMYFVVQSDHQTLSILKSSESTSGRLQRWSWARQPFHFRFKYFKGNDILGDFLWRHFKFSSSLDPRYQNLQGLQILGGAYVTGCTSSDPSKD